MIPRFRHAGPPGASVRFTIDGRPAEAPEGVSLAAALLLAGVDGFRPLCLMGSCQGCLVSIDGGVRERACLAPVRAGADVRLA